MTYKAAAAGLDLGGGKAVIFGDPATDKSEALLRVYARYVDSLGGRYITAEDVGTTQADMDMIRRETRFVTGVSQELGGSGDPSAATAYGVLWAMKAVARRLWGHDLAGRPPRGRLRGGQGGHQPRPPPGGGAGPGDGGRRRRRGRGAGRRRLRRRGGRGGEDPRPRRRHLLARAPWAGPSTPTTIPELRCAAVVGSANNQLATPDCDELLHRLGVLYAPDYVVNAGGVINIASELSPRGYHPGRAYEQVRRIFDTVTTVLDAAEAEGIPTGAAADRFAEGRIAAPAARPPDPDVRVAGAVPMAKVFDEELASRNPVPDRHTELGLSGDEVVAMYRSALLARTLDQRMWNLNRQGRARFVISGQGQEGTQVGSAWALRAGYDIALPYYRDFGVVLTLGMTPYEVFLAVLARADDPNSGGRQMPNHWGCKRLNIITGSSPIATQLPHAAGLAQASAIRGDDRVTVVLVRRGGVVEGRLPRGPQLRRHPPPAGGVRVREQPLRHLGDDGPAVGGGRRGRPGRRPTACRA